MAPNRSNPRKGVKFLDTKILIATLSLAVTLGFWNLFSDQNIQNLKKSAADNQDPTLQAQSVDQSSLPPLPTISPLVNVKTETIQLTTAQNAQQSAGSAPLRSVTAPDEKIVQKGAPVVDMGQPVVVVVSAGGSRPAGGAPAPLTTTKSSK